MGGANSGRYLAQRAMRGPQRPRCYTAYSCEDVVGSWSEEERRKGKNVLTLHQRTGLQSAVGIVQTPSQTPSAHYPHSEKSQRHLFRKIEGKDPVHHHAHGHSQVIKVVREFEGDLHCDIEPIRWNLRVEVCTHSTRKAVLRCVQCCGVLESRREARAAHGTYLQNSAVRRVYYVKAHN